MTTLRNQISKNVIDAMNTSDNPRIDKDEGTKKRSLLWGYGQRRG